MLLRRRELTWRRRSELRQRLSQIRNRRSQMHRLRRLLTLWLSRRPNSRSNRRQRRQLPTRKHEKRQPRPERRQRRKRGRKRKQLRRKLEHRRSPYRATIRNSKYRLGSSTLRPRRRLLQQLSESQLQPGLLHQWTLLRADPAPLTSSS